MARGNQFARQWTLLRHLGAGGLAVDDAARRLGCTTRTRWRDLHLLQDGTRQGVFARAFWTYLAFGQWTHVGSNTTFGLGGYRVQTAAVEAS